MVDSPRSLIEIVHLLLHLISGDGIHLGSSEATIPLRLMHQGCQHKVLGLYRNSPDLRYSRDPDRRDNQVPSHRENALSYHKGRLLIQDLNGLDLLVSLRLRKRISLPGVNRNVDAMVRVTWCGRMLQHPSLLQYDESNDKLCVSTLPKQHKYLALTDTRYLVDCTFMTFTDPSGSYSCIIDRDSPFVATFDTWRQDTF